MTSTYVTEKLYFQSSNQQIKKRAQYFHFKNPYIKFYGAKDNQEEARSRKYVRFFHCSQPISPDDIALASPSYGPASQPSSMNYRRY